MRNVDVIRWGSVVLLLFTTACVLSGVPARSGFLKDYGSLTPDTEEKKVYLARNPQLSSGQVAAKYSSFLIEPVVMYLGKDSGGLGFRPDEAKGLTDYLQEELTAGLSKSGFWVVSIPGPDVAHIRIAMTHVLPTRLKLASHPSITALNLERAVLEVEFVDSKTGEPIAALIDARNRAGNIQMDVRSVDKNARAVIQEWTRLIVDKLNTIYAK